jgi:hypothetical protein
MSFVFLLIWLASAVLASPILSKAGIDSTNEDKSSNPAVHASDDFDDTDDYGMEWDIVSPDSEPEIVALYRDAEVYEFVDQDLTQLDKFEQGTSMATSDNPASLEQIFKRHNWAMICYNINPDKGIGQPHVSLTNRCRSEKGYLCTWLGVLYKTTKDDTCELFCRCRNLYPEFGSCIKQAVAPWLNCLKHRGIDEGEETALMGEINDSDYLDSTIRDLVNAGHTSEERELPLDRRHSWA